MGSDKALLDRRCHGLNPIHAHLALKMARTSVGDDATRGSREVDQNGSKTLTPEGMLSVSTVTS